jgi:threonylcarbamoyladenosine tRNA methylthiotransferase MtaB
MKVYLDMVGCRLNQAEIEQMARQFRAQGHEIVGAAGAADLVVVNTCTVTSEAAADSRQKIRRAAGAGAGGIIVTGCWATLQPQAAAELPGVTRVTPNERKDFLVADLLHLETFNLEPLDRMPLPGLRQRTRAFIKVQDGCDNACTFCITTLARGASRSRPAEEVIPDIRAALHGGAQEIVLTGVHLGSWGFDFKARLSQLISQILHETEVPRMRLSSLEPWDLDEKFFSLWADSSARAGGPRPYESRLMPHLHLPLQSGSAATLKRMSRKTSPESFRQLVESARKAIPGVAITTDVIAGFPAETEAEFSETLAFIDAMQFAGGHVFTYSARPGTPAARIREQVPHEIRKERNHILQQAFNRMARAYREQFIGQRLPVLWEASAERNERGWQIEGLTPNYIRVTATVPEPRWNQVDMVRLTGLTEVGLVGEIR